ncbi:MAG: hypothetical protein Q4D89_13340 [Arachnia propionica]|uniref:hypothetical protein n=1 Tax=Arachnia propionica TaxID=1750 RepID=UPI00270BEF91|nr:hypothetical protein [Arachnia propionica]
MEGIAFGYEELLQDYQVNGVHPSMRMRAMGLLILHVGIPAEQVAMVAGRSVSLQPHSWITQAS